MIDYIRYTVNGVTYSLSNNGDGTWSKEATAPAVAGNYSLALEISENGIITYIDSSDSRYEFYLEVLVSTERVVFLESFVPDFIAEIEEFKSVFNIENKNFDELHSELEKVKGDMFITTASSDAITRIETFLRIKGQGTLQQRKSFLISILQKGKKLNEQKIKEISNTITGSDCIITFFGANEINNPEAGNGLLRVQILSPSNNKDYKYDDIVRTLKPLVPGHLKLLVIKYFSAWADVISNYANWSAVKTANDWQIIKDYIPPQ